MIDRVLQDTVTVVYRSVTSTDRYGNDVIAETSRVDLSGWMHQRSADDLSHPTPHADVGDWVLYLPPLLPVDHLTHYEFEGATFETVGLPRRSKAPGRGEHHIEVELKEHRG